MSITAHICGIPSLLMFILHNQLNKADRNSTIYISLQMAFIISQLHLLVVDVMAKHITGFILYLHYFFLYVANNP